MHTKLPFDIVGCVSFLVVFGAFARARALLPFIVVCHLPTWCIDARRVLPSEYYIALGAGQVDLRQRAKHALRLEMKRLFETKI